MTPPPGTPINGMDLPQARRSFLIQLQQLTGLRREIENTDLSKLNGEQVAALYHRHDVAIINLALTDDRIEDLLEEQATTRDRDADD